VGADQVTEIDTKLPEGLVLEDEVVPEPLPEGFILEDEVAPEAPEGLVLEPLPDRPPYKDVFLPGPSAAEAPAPKEATQFLDEVQGEYVMSEGLIAHSQPGKMRPEEIAHAVLSPDPDAQRILLASREATMRGWSYKEMVDHLYEGARFDAITGALEPESIFGTPDSINRPETQQRLANAYVIETIRAGIQFGRTPGVKSYEGTKMYLRLVQEGEEELAEALVQDIRMEEQLDGLKVPVSMDGYAPGDWLRNINIAIMQGTSSVLGIAHRALGDDEFARDATRYSNAIEGKAPKGRLQQAIRGTIRSGPSLLSGFMVGGPVGAGVAIGSGTLLEMNDAVSQGEIAGLKDDALFWYVMRRGGIEAVISSAFQLARMGGAEDIISKGLLSGAKRGFLPVLKGVGKRVGHELLEENGIEFVSAINDRWSGTDPNALRLDNLAEMLAAVTAQTLLTMGLMSSPALIASPVSRHARNAHIAAIAEKHGIVPKSLIKAFDSADIKANGATEGEILATWTRTIEDSLAEQGQPSLQDSMAVQAADAMETEYNRIVPPEETKETEAAPEVEGKQAHEMTKAEFDSNVFYHGTARPKYAREAGKVTQGYLSPEATVSDAYRRGGSVFVVLKPGSDRPIGMLRSMVNTESSPGPWNVVSELTSDEALANPHKFVVQQALAEGKTIPAEVLAEYPDLAPAPIEGKQASRVQKPDAFRRAETRAVARTRLQPEGQVKYDLYNDILDEAYRRWQGKEPDVVDANFFEELIGGELPGPLSVFAAHIHEVANTKQVEITDPALREWLSQSTAWADILLGEVQRERQNSLHPDLQKETTGAEGVARGLDAISKMISGEKTGGSLAGEFLAFEHLTQGALEGHDNVLLTIELAGIAPAPTEGKKKTVLQLKKEARNLGIDVSDIKGKGAAALIEARLTEAEAARPDAERGRAPLTAEEEFTLQQTEATLEAAAPYGVKPNLYIGNLTQRAKNAIGAAFKIAPERIKGFMEGGVSTVRTAIDLTVGEARTLLYVMESNMDGQLTNDRIHYWTHPEMAQMKANWGDIRELRTVLGLPIQKQPFRIIRVAQRTQVLVIENIGERVAKAVEPSKADQVQVSKLDRLRQVLRRVAKAAKEGHKLGKKEMRQLYAEAQYLRKQLELRDRLIGRIQKPPTKGIDFWYREAITSLQDSIDFEAEDSTKQQAKAKLREIIDNNPEKANEISADLIDTLEKTDIADLDFASLQELDAEIERLRHLGRLKSTALKNYRKARMERQAKRFVGTIGKAKKSLIPMGRKIRNFTRPWTLRMQRIFDMLDGGKQFLGEIHDFFYWVTNQNTNVELQNTDARLRSMRYKRDAMGLTLGHLNRRRTIGDLTLTVDEMLSVYAGWKNPRSRAALKYGGVAQKRDGAVVYVEVADQIAQDIEEALTENERAWGDTIIAEYAQHWDRHRNAVIRAENRDPGNEINYTPARRVDAKYENPEQAILDDLKLRHPFSQVGPNKAFTIQRQDLSDEHQIPIELGLTKLWMQEVRTQEHYTNHALHMKDMGELVDRSDFKAAVVDRFGEPALQGIEHWLKSIANPSFYKAHTLFEKASKLLRKHAALAYIGWRYITIAKQVPSIMMYWANTSTLDMFDATLTALFHPIESYERAKDIHYQIAHQHIEREISELRQADSKGYERIIGKIGQAGMYGIMAMDRTIKVIGINAVYNNAIALGQSPQAAAKKAATVTLNTQPAAMAKDLAQLYSSNEILNWFTMFTNQLNQLYNIATYDLPTAMRNRHYLAAGRSVIALSTMATLIWMLTNRDVPDEPEDIAEAIGEQAVNSLPFFGRYVTAALKGHTPEAPAPFQAVAGTVKAGVALIKGDSTKALETILEPLAVTAGLPLAPLEAAVGLIEED